VAAVSEASLGAWLVKASPSGLQVGEAVRTSFRTVTRRCVRPSYRVDLVRAGQPVLLWVSGRDPEHPAGIYATGHTTGPVEHGDEVSMPLHLEPVEPFVARTEILVEHDLLGLEVIRMPAGSNPSYLDIAQYRTLRQAFPRLHIGWTP
jgi:hypothetical protein